MDLSPDERIFLKELLKLHLDEVIKEGKIIITDETPTFLAAEGKYEEFVSALIEKLTNGS